MGGGLYLTPALPDITEILSLGSSAPRKNPGSLSVREREVLQLVVEGRSAKEIGDVLHLSAKTVEFHKYNMMKKLGLHTTIELAKYAMERQLFAPVAGKSGPSAG